MSDERSVSLDPQEVRESGLLLYWNERFLWPWGLTLKVAQWDQPESAAWRATWDVARAEVLSRMDAESLSASDLLAVMEAEMAGRIRDKWSPGFDIQRIEPPDAIQTAYSPERHRELIRSAQAWLRNRRLAIRKRTLGG